MINILKSLIRHQKNSETTAPENNLPVSPSKTYKYSVVSYLFNDYDKVHEVKDQSDDVRYVMITDNKRLKSKSWEIHHYSEYKVLNDIPDMIGRMYYVKYHPFEFCNTNICFTVDANIVIMKSLNRIYDDFLHSKSEYGLPIHPYRKSVYDELTFWRNARGLSIAEVNSQKHLFGKTFFDKYVLFQTNLIMRKNGKVANAIDDLTWSFMKLTATDGYSARLDNTILTYAAATYMSNSKYFLFSQDIMSSSYLQWMTHTTNVPIYIDDNHRIAPTVFGTRITPYRIE